MRFVSLRLARESESPDSIYSAECAACGEQSPGADGPDSPQDWSLRHAGRTGHTGFRLVITSHWRVAPV